LADTGAFVSELCLGTMTFGGTASIWATIGGLDQNAATALVHRALDAGINFVDTANVYSAGESETMVGHALKGRQLCPDPARSTVERAMDRNPPAHDP
jgi:aryl-alcohol dehydrogenase-like predicted oxidoreductase